MTAYLWNTESLSANECKSYLYSYSRSGDSHHHNYDLYPHHLKSYSKSNFMIILNVCQND